MGSKIILGWKCCPKDYASRIIPHRVFEMPSLSQHLLLELKLTLRHLKLHFSLLKMLIPTYWRNLKVVLWWAELQYLIL